MRELAELQAYANDAVFQPDFGVIRGRARRLRRRRRVLAAGAAVLLVVAGFLAYAENRPHREVLPSVTAADMSDLAATGTKDLYGVHKACRSCAVELYASADAGATWHRRTSPPAPDLGGLPRDAVLIALGRNALLWRESNYPTPLEKPGTPEPDDIPDMLDHRLWLTLDGGRTWRRPTVSTSPVASVADGFEAIDCLLLGRRRPCPLYAVDTSSGIIAPLATQPPVVITPEWSFRTSVPLGGGILWVPGLDPVTRKPAVASSTDGGRSWHTTVFAAGAAAPRTPQLPVKYYPQLAAGADGLAYATIYRAGDQVTPYRTTDFGRTWTPLAPLTRVPDAGYVTADGAHVVYADVGFRSSRGGATYTPVTLPGYPAGLARLPETGHHAAPGRYLISSKDEYWTSDNGWVWRPLG